MYALGRYGRTSETYGNCSIKQLHAVQSVTVIVNILFIKPI